MTTAYGNVPIPSGIRSRIISNNNGLDMHVLEAGFEQSGRPHLLLLHGFPELAYSWRKVMPALADAGYHVIAPDQRGYGRTAGWSKDYDGDLRPFSMPNLVRDIVGLVAALGIRSIDAVIGHDSGSFVAGCCALIRPDLFHSVAMMSAPVAGIPAFPHGSSEAPGKIATEQGDIHAQMAALNPPRKHYQWYYSTRPANDDMVQCRQGVHDFMRAYYHHKSADWKDNKPFPLTSWSATELAKMPTYYIMRHDQNMAETVAEHMPSPPEIAACKWFPDDELRVYTSEYTRNGYQGGLQWYRCMTSGLNASELRLFSGRTIDVPSCFIAGRSDWGIYQKPGSMEAMQHKVCTDMRGVHLVDGAGHWVQQEQPERVSEFLLAFLEQNTK